MSIFNIGKANERISALEAELASEKQKAKEAADAASENAKIVEKAADDLKKERDEIKGKFDAEVSAHASTKSQLEKANSELATAKAAVTDFDAKVATAAGAKALQIVASQGAPAISNKPADPAVDPAKQKITELRGLAKVQAAIALEIANKR